MNYNFHTGTIINYFVQVQIMPELPAVAAVLLPAILERLEPLRQQQVLAVDLVATPHHHRLLAGLPGPQIQTRLSHPRGPCHAGKVITKQEVTISLERGPTYFFQADLFNLGSCGFFCACHRIILGYAPLTILLAYWFCLEFQNSASRSMRKFFKSPNLELPIAIYQEKMSKKRLTNHNVQFLIQSFEKIWDISGSAVLSHLLLPVHEHSLKNTSFSQKKIFQAKFSDEVVSVSKQISDL